MSNDEFEKITLNWYEYIVFGLVLIGSLGIGVFYGFFDRKNKTNEEFLMAGRSMSVLPVTLSLLCSFISAVTLLGNPVETYFYGSQLSFLSYIPITIALIYIYVPVYFDLQLTSAYQYFEWRFSPAVRKIVAIISITHLMTYMPTTIWGPSLALEQVAGIDPYVSSAIIFLVCIAYSSMGGLKAVLWTDAVQAAVIIASLLSILGFGLYELGGFGSVWEVARATNRASWFKLDVDPRTRHTLWTSIVGSYFVWVPLFAATQAQIQRYNSVPTLKSAKLCLFYNMLGLMFISACCSFTGLMIYTKYQNCDPVSSKGVSSADQLLPLFVMDVLRKYPLIPGLLVAGLTCGSLSSVSSALNALAALIVEDFVKRIKPDLSELKLAVAGKLASFGVGMVGFGLVFVIAIVNETIQIQPFAGVMIGMLYGPIFGAFTLGIVFPWANTIGTMCGIVSSILLTGVVGLGGIIAGRKGMAIDQKLALTTAGCRANSTAAILGENYSGIMTSTTWKDESYSFAKNLWNISYMWHAMIACLTTIIVGLAVSALVNQLNKKANPRLVNHSLLSKPFLKFWRICFGQKHLNKWIDYDSPPHCGKRTVRVQEKK